MPVLLAPCDMILLWEAAVDRCSCQNLVSKSLQILALTPFRLIFASVHLRQVARACADVVTQEVGGLCVQDAGPRRVFSALTQ